MDKDLSVMHCQQANYEHRAYESPTGITPDIFLTRPMCGAHVMILAVITIIPTYEGDPNAWWARIVIGVLLLVLILLQRVAQSRKT